MITEKQIRYAKSMRDLADYQEEDIRKLRAAADWIEANGAPLELLDTTQVGKWIEIKTATREQLMAALKAFPGKWHKTPGPDGTGTINYELDCGDVVLQCLSAPPPPSCRIVEKWVDVPAQPASRKLMRLVECTPSVSQAEEPIAV